MNCFGYILTDGLPLSVLCNNKYYRINPDFKVIIKILHELELGSSLSDLAHLFFTDGIPPHPDDCIADFIGRDYLPSQNSAFSFFYDAGLIIGAFMECYHIDLLNTDMHWKKFAALFMSLGGYTAFSELIRCRCADFSDPKSRAAARRISARYDRRFLDL